MTTPGRTSSDAAPAPDALVRRCSQLGDFEIVHCSDGTLRMDGGAMFGVVPKVLWERRMPADAQNRVLLGLNTAVVRTGKHTVVIETGVGNKQPAKMRELQENQELLPASLQAADVRPEEVDIVVNTHLHFDHCGWNTTRRPDGTVTPTFPNARYFAAEGEVAHAHRQLDRDRVSYHSDNYDPLLRSGQMTLLSDEEIRGGAALCDGVSVEFFPGHTQHMMGIHLQSRAPGGATVHGCYIGDLLPTSAHLQPTWCMGFDLDPLRVIEERKRFLGKAIPEGWMVLFPHDHAMPAARLVLDERGRPVAEGWVS